MCAGCEVTTVDPIYLLPPPLPLPTLDRHATQLPADVLHQLQQVEASLEGKDVRPLALATTLASQPPPPLEEEEEQEEESAEGLEEHEEVAAAAAAEAAGAKAPPSSSEKKLDLQLGGMLERRQIQEFVA